MTYEYVAIALYEAGEATSAMNKYAAEGYRLVQAVPTGNHSVIIMEREQMTITHANAAEQHFTVKPRFHIGQIVKINIYPDKRWVIQRLFPAPETAALMAEVRGPLAGSLLSDGAETYFVLANQLEPADAEA